MKIIRSWSKPYKSDLIGRKHVDWSIFEYGSVIPEGFYKDFAKPNLRYLKVGEKVTVKLLVNDSIYEAILENKPRKNTNIGGTLQIRYDHNQNLKELIKHTFDKSYSYFIYNRTSGSKNAIRTPDHIAEYIDFYQTEEPFVYRLQFITKGSVNRSFWWVNQGQTHRQEKEGGYIWAPQVAKNGTPLSHHTDLLKAKVGDVVFAYSGRMIRAIGVVEKECEKHAKPKEIASDSWETDGLLVRLRYIDLNHPIDKNDIPIDWRIEEDGPFDRNGNVKQGYFYQVSKQFINKFVERYKSDLPTEVIDLMRGAIGGETMPTQPPSSSPVNLNGKELINHIHSYINNKGFYFEKEEITNLYLSLRSKPFVILSGISGTGKTQIVKLLAESLGATSANGQYKLIPVRPDWSDSSDLLGYVDIKGEFKPGPLTEIIRLATDHPEKPYFAVLDEMNLARVEYYFSDVLSVMESRDWKDDIIVTDQLVEYKDASTLAETVEVITLPSNLYIFGTVNMDETTHPFSKKVLDRANTIEFNRVKLDDFTYLQRTKAMTSLVIDNEHLQTQYLFLKDVYQQHKSLVERATTELVKVNKILEGIGAHVGYRVRDEVCIYLAYNEEEGFMDFHNAFDHCLLQKVLPRLAGSDHTISNVLDQLLNFCIDKHLQINSDMTEEELSSAKYPKSAAKLLYMRRRLQENGFTSFWIAS